MNDASELRIEAVSAERLPYQRFHLSRDRTRAYPPLRLYLATWTVARDVV